MIVPTQFHETIAGVAAGVAGTVLGFPLDNIKTRMQTQKGSGYSSVPATFKTILRNEGALGFYRGVLAPLSALTQFVYARLKCCRSW